MTTAQDILSVLGERLGGNANVRNVFGEPVNAEGRTIIPVARIACGMGAGAGGMEKAAESGSDRSGGGGGGGMVAMPVGVVEISAAGTRFIGLRDTKRIAFAAVSGVLTGMVLGRYRKSRIR